MGTRLFLRVLVSVFWIYYLYTFFVGVKLELSKSKKIQKKEFTTLPTLMSSAFAKRLKC